MTTDEKLRDEKLRYDIKREAEKIALSPEKIDTVFSLILNSLIFFSNS